MTIYTYVDGLIVQAKEQTLIERADEIYVRNQMLHLLQIETYPNRTNDPTIDSIPNLLEKLIDYAVNHAVIENDFDQKEMLAAKIMNCFIARPSVINNTFYKKYNESPEKAMNYFYGLSKHSNYIQTKRIARNVHFKTATKYGELDLTINLSKPEKNPAQLIKERERKETIDYPACVLCVENEGYVGRTGYAARANHRMIRMSLLNENWYFQYSPYVYYNEHSIVLAEKHEPMKINKLTFMRLISFVEKIPHYFIGSNADLPIVGGSILSHNHYQAGNYEFPMARAEPTLPFSLTNYKSVEASLLKWPITVIRLRGEIKAELVDAANHIFSVWKQFGDEEASIKSHTGNKRHNTVTPIARFRNGKFELDLALRNNRTTKAHPFGTFHPHEDIHHIKRENIGLIEVMGLAILPGRLKEELHQVKAFLLNKKSNVANYHLTWAKEIKEQHAPFVHPAYVDQILEKELGFKFLRVLEDVSVFKQTEVGLQASKRFVDAVKHTSTS